MVRMIAIVPIISVLLSWQTNQVNGQLITAAWEAGQTAYSVYEAVRSFVNFLSTGIYPVNVENPNLEIVQGLKSIDFNLRNFHNKIFDLWEKEAVTKISQKINDIEKDILFVQQQYQGFQDILNNNFTEDLWRYSENALSAGKGKLTHTILNLHHTLAGNSSDGNLLFLLANKKDYILMCLKRKTTQQMLIELYNNVMVADLKTLTLKLYSIEGNQSMPASARSNKSKFELDKFNNRSVSSYEVTLKIMEEAQRDLWACDPKLNKSGKVPEGSYAKIPVFQKFLTTERDRINRKNGESYSCFRNTKCSDLNNEFYPYRYGAFSTFADLLEPKLRCEKGRIAECESTTYNKIQVCPAPQTDDRRYLGIKYVDDEGMPQTRGDYNRYCVGPKTMETPKYAIANCRICLCTCIDSNKKLDRYFSLRPALSNVDEGMVVTGVRLVKHDRVFYIEVKQGLLKENGTIDSSEEHGPQWVNATRIDLDSLPEEAFFPPPPDRRGYKKNDDIYPVNYRLKTVLLDDLVADDGDFVLTGLQFQRIDDDQDEDDRHPIYDMLALRVRVHSFDYKTGKILDKGKWIPSTDKGLTRAGRKRIFFDNADDPIKKARGESHIMMTTSETFFEFGVSGSEADMGQNTVPFIDMQEVVTDPPIPLAGAGLYHKNTRHGDSGGFFGLKVTNYDLSKGHKI